MQSRSAPAALSSLRILLCGGVVVSLAMGLRHGLGLWFVPMSTTYAWPREVFSSAMALQNLTWGIAGVFAGLLADRWGAQRILLVGALLYALGLAGMAMSTDAWTLALFCGLFLGLAQAGTTYAMIFGIIGRHIAANQRSMAMGITAAAGSFGQFLMLPIDHLLIGWLNWQNALVFCAFLALLIMPMALYLGENGSKNAASTASRLATGPSAPSAQLKAWPALRQALAAPSFRWLMVGYFVCGFQVVFIGVHLPTFLRDARLPDHVAVTCLALVGLLNIVGTWLAGWLGQHYDRRYILAGIYAGRALVIAIFIALPLSALSAYVFAAVMGILWLSTVPPTNAIVVHRFGPRHFSMLSGFVFFAHQLGSTTGVWLAGWLYDLSHSYTVMWWCSIALGVMAAGANLRIRRQDAQ